MTTLATVECDHCRGTGQRYDITCADNVATSPSAVSACRACRGAGRVSPRQTERPYWLEPGYVPVTTLPAELDWMS